MGKRLKKRRRNPLKGNEIGRLIVIVSAALIVMRVLSYTGATAAADQLLRNAAQNENFVNATLSFELGDIASESDYLDSMGGLEASVLAQSSLLSSSENAVVTFLSGESDDTENQENSGNDQQSTDSPSETSDVQATSDGGSGNSNIVETTLVASSSDKYVSANGVYILNETSLSVDAVSLFDSKINIKLGTSGPQVLIIHTHGSEAYTKEAGETYEESDTYRTEDKNYSVIKVGNKIAEVFESNGISVVHDEEFYDYPTYNGCYSRALTAIQTYLEKYPSIKFVIDVHRDAMIASNGTIYKPVATINGEKVAQVMLVMGTNASGLYHPNWKENLKLAIKIQAQLNADYPTLARPIDLRSSRFNEHATTGSMLVEIGSNGNTLSEALKSAELFANAAAKVILSLK